ncbi:MAG: hypothetical protein KatS3mg065_1285 [Chloroflexota bacterium]|nr:MAG: hypothetical protein KatS3mg065_1285 [Chloroflexota bacterium]
MTPAHDATDLEIARRHGLPFVTVLDEDGRVNANGGPYAGLDRFEARTAILRDLEAAGDLVGATPHELILGRCQRSNDVIEPMLRTQWFIRTAPLAEKALAATRSRRTIILPARFEAVWEHWLTNIRDWNVSRQLWWGHRIPAWYCPDGHVTVTDDPAGPTGCAVCGRPAAELEQDPDIFDTWYSSGLWPFSTLGWPEETPDLRRFYPSTVMETAYDIIFFWVARMMMLGLELMGEVPFRYVYLSGLVRDPYGQKMSKTKGNVVDPLETIDEFGADALRFALVHGTAPGADSRLGRAKLENARNFANKLWNAARFVLGARPDSIPADAPRTAPDPAHLGPAERWLRSRLAATIVAADRAIADFAFGELTRLLYEAIWGEYCDWALELAKVRLADPRTSLAEREATWWTLVEGLDTYLRLLHPLMPFVTEAIWGAIPHQADDPELLIVADWPTAGERDAAAEAEVGSVLELVRAIRNARTEAGIEPGQRLPLSLAVPDSLSATVSALRGAIERLARVGPVEVVEDPAALAPARAAGGLTVLAGPLEAVVGQPVADERVLALERERLERDLAEAEARLAAARARLANPAFLERAPAAIVEGARARETELAAEVDRIRGRLAELERGG